MAVRWWGLSPNVLRLAAAMGLWGLGFGLYGTLWPLYVETLGGSALAIGWLATLAGVVTAASALPGGYCADRFDRRGLIRWGWALAVPAPFLFAWAPHWQWLALGVFLYFGTSFSTPAAQAYIQAEAGNRLALAYNVVMGAFAIGAVLGPATGGFVVARVGFHPVFYLSGLIFLGSTVIVWPIDRAPATGPPRGFIWRGRPRLFRWIALTAVLALAGGLAGPYVVPFWRTVGGLSVQTIGLVSGLTLLVGAATGPLWGRLAERVGLPFALGLGVSVGLVGIVGLFGWPRILWGQVSAAGVRGVGGGSHLLTGVAVGRVVRAPEAGTAYGVLNLAAETAGALAPFPGALLYRFRPEAPLVFQAAILALVAVWAMTARPGGVPP
jgi:hypothetical protein